MPDKIRDVTHFSRYFNIEAPSSQLQALLFIVLGIATGIIADVSTHPHSPLLSAILYGVSIGTIIITVPGVLTVMFIKAMKRRIQMKHAFFAVLAVLIVYSLFIIITSFFFALTHEYLLAYFIVILANACIYGYWFLINRVVMSQKRSQIVTAAVQPILNILFFIPVSRYLFDTSISLSVTLVKLWSGMLVFMAIGYLILFIMDRPAKKALKISGVDLISAMVSQWLYDITKDTEVFNGTGVKRDVNVDVLALKGKKGIKALFINPDIHYGPFHEIGGGVATESIGRKIKEQFDAAPFLLHGAVSFEDNPISTRQIHNMSNTIATSVSSLPNSSFRQAKGSITFGRDGSCNAIALSINESCILTLTKAPTVTEDISKHVGERLEGIATKRFKNIMLVDAHNSRTESSNWDELRGIYDGSKYIPKYENAIRQSMNGASHKSHSLIFGASSERLSKRLNRRDLGTGYTSVGIFNFGGRRFCMIYFDANNMLPSFREDVINHVRKHFGMTAELYTTDTHSVNTIALPASNVLGRETKPGEMMPILDSMIKKAIENSEKVECSYTKTVIKGFKVWGKGTEDILLNVSREVINSGKRKVPIIIAAGFLIAAWVIYMA